MQMVAVTRPVKLHIPAVLQSDIWQCLVVKQWTALSIQTIYCFHNDVTNHVITVGFSKCLELHIYTGNSM